MVGQYNDKIKNKRENNDIQNIIQRTKDRENEPH